MMRTCSPNKEQATALALWHSGQVRAMCTERANWTIIVIVTEREERREEKENERKREGEERASDRGLPCVQNVPVCTFKTKRAFCWYTRTRFEPTHGGVLNLHTGSFSRVSRHTTQHAHTTPHTPTDTHQHTHTNRHTQHTRHHHTHKHTHTQHCTHTQTHTHTTHTSHTKHTPHTHEG